MTNDNDDDIELDDLNDIPKEKPRQRPRRRGLPQRSKSDHGGALIRAASLRNMNQTATKGTKANLKGNDLDPKRQNALGSKSDHACESWFDFGTQEVEEEEAPLQDWTKPPARALSTGNSRHSLHSSSKHSIASTISDDGEMSGDSFHGDDSPPDNRKGRRGGLQRSSSMRRKVASDRRRDVQRGVARHHSGDRPATAGGGRRVPTRTRSDAMTSARREQMKAMYRSQADGSINPHSNSSGAAGLRRPPQGLNATPPRLGSIRDLSGAFQDLQVSSSHDSFPLNSNHDSSVGTDIPRHSESGATGRRVRMERSKSGLEVGALGATLGRPPARSRSDDSIPGAPSVSSEEKTPNKSDRKWLERRANKQTEILSLAHDVRDRLEEDRERHEMEESHHMHGHLENAGSETAILDDDDDQPMAMRTKKTALEQLKKVVNKTGAGARSFGKGTVNAISDPKLAAKRFGHLSKDVGKATIKTALDPKKMAKGAKNVTVGSAKMGAGLTKGVAKTTFGATKTVVKGGVSAASGGAKLTMKGTKKMVKGTVRVVKGKDKNKHKGENTTYDARELAERNQSNFYDRIAQLVETSDSSAEDKEKAAAEAAALAAMAMNEQPEKGSKKKRKSLKKGAGSSVLMPTDLIGKGAGSWDV